jgi:peptidoglycan/LPS O-acetylase OafA/YrhL
MRISFAVYAALYVVVELVGSRLESIGWPQISALDVATAVTDACLLVAVAAAVLLGLDLGIRRWRAAAAAAREERLAEQDRDAGEPIGVTSWRAEPLALPAGPSAASVPVSDYAGIPAPRPFPEEPGRLL